MRNYKLSSDSPKMKVPTQFKKNSAAEFFIIQKNQQLENASSLDGIDNASSKVERNCSKRGFIKSRAVRDANTTTPFPSCVS